MEYIIYKIVLINSDWEWVLVWKNVDKEYHDILEKGKWITLNDSCCWDILWWRDSIIWYELDKKCEIKIRNDMKATYRAVEALRVIVVVKNI